MDSDGEGDVDLSDEEVDASAARAGGASASQSQPRPPVLVLSIDSDSDADTEDEALAPPTQMAADSEAPTAEAAAALHGKSIIGFRCGSTVEGGEPCGRFFQMAHACTSHLQCEHLVVEPEELRRLSLPARAPTKPQKMKCLHPKREAAVASVAAAAAAAASGTAAPPAERCDAVLSGWNSLNQHLGSVHHVLPAGRGRYGTVVPEALPALLPPEAAVDKASRSSSSESSSEDERAASADEEQPKSQRKLKPTTKLTARRPAAQLSKKPSPAPQAKQVEAEKLADEPPAKRAETGAVKAAAKPSEKRTDKAKPSEKRAGKSKPAVKPAEAPAKRGKQPGQKRSSNAAAASSPANVAAALSSAAAAAAAQSSSSSDEEVDRSSSGGEEGLETCSESDWSDVDRPDRSKWTEDEQEQLWPMLWRKMDIRQGKFRRTKGWPRQLDGHPCEDEDSAENFDFCWRCSKTKKDGAQFAQLYACDGICQRSFHLKCIGKSKRPRDDTPFFCYECAHARFPKPKGPKRSKEQRRRSKPPRLGSSNRADPLRRTVLMCAIEDHRLRSDPAHPHAYLTYLLNTPGRVERRVRRSINHADEERGYTALHYATSHSCLAPAAVTLRLLELGADPNARSSYKDDYKAGSLHFAFHRQDMNAILPLLSDPRTDMRAKCRGQLAFMNARCYSHGRGWSESARAQWAICYVFSVLFAYAEQLIAPKAIDEDWLQDLLVRAMSNDMHDALRFAYMVLHNPGEAAEFRTQFNKTWVEQEAQQQQQQQQQQPQQQQATEPQPQPQAQAAAAAAAAAASDAESIASAPMEEDDVQSHVPSVQSHDVVPRPLGGRAQQQALILALFAAVRQQFEEGEIPPRRERVMQGLQQWGEWCAAFHARRPVKERKSIGGAASVAPKVTGQKRPAASPAASAKKKGTHSMPKRSRPSDTPGAGVSAAAAASAPSTSR